MNLVTISLPMVLGHRVFDYAGNFVPIYLFSDESCGVILLHAMPWPEGFGVKNDAGKTWESN